MKPWLFTPTPTQLYSMLLFSKKFKAIFLKARSADLYAWKFDPPCAFFDQSIDAVTCIKTLKWQNIGIWLFKQTTWFSSSHSVERYAGYFSFIMSLRLTLPGFLLRKLTHTNCSGNWLIIVSHNTPGFARLLSKIHGKVISLKIKSWNLFAVFRQTDRAHLIGRKQTNNAKKCSRKLGSWLRSNLR